eukprot:3301527-Prymnesium_polylepis.1
MMADDVFGIERVAPLKLEPRIRQIGAAEAVIGDRHLLGVLEHVVLALLRAASGVRQRAGAHLLPPALEVEAKVGGIGILARALLGEPLERLRQLLQRPRALDVDGEHGEKTPREGELFGASL